jgi:hypothetical protein
MAISRETNIYIINTNARWFGGNSPHDKWFSYERAFTGENLENWETCP